MKRYIITLILLITCTFTLTGCRNQTTDSGFKGNVEIAWDDVKDDFDQIDQDVENDTSKQDSGNFNSVLVFDTQHNKNCIYQSPAGPMELVSDTKKIRVLHGDAHFKLQLKYSLIMNGMLVSDYDLTVLAKFME